jgi:hypothetical protein
MLSQVALKLFESFPLKFEVEIVFLPLADVDITSCTHLKFRSASKIFLGSEPSKTEEKHLLPNPEFSSVLSSEFEISFVNLFFVIVCLSLISMAKMQRNGRQGLESFWKVFGKFFR